MNNFICNLKNKIFYKSLNKYNALLNAIYYLKVDKVNELLNKLTNNEIKNDLLNQVFKHLSLKKTSKEYLTIEQICHTSFDSKSTDKIIAVQLMLNILESICLKFPFLIDEKIYEIPNLFEIEQIIEILNKYNLNLPKCYFCNSDNQYNLIKSMCDCNIYNHIECLTNYIINNIECEKCKKKYEFYNNSSNKIQFPKQNIYYDFNNLQYIKIKLKDKFKSLYYAKINFQVELVEKILNSLNSIEFQQYIEQYNHIFIQTCIISEEIKINNLFLVKYENINKYQCCINKIDISFGPFIFCKNIYSPIGSGYTLTNNIENHNKYSLLLSINMNYNLMQNTEQIKLYDSNNLLFGYSKKPIDNLNWMYFSLIKSNMIGTNITISFCKKILLEENNFCFKLQMQEIYTIKVNITNPILYGDHSECNICLENVNKQNIYITPCGHLFHLNCIFDYLEFNNKLYLIHSYCTETFLNGKQSCCNTKKIKKFNCPCCNYNIIASYN